MIKSFHAFNEGKNTNQNSVTPENFSEIVDKLAIFIMTNPDEQLKKGFAFTKEHFKDYDTDQFTKDLIDSFFENITAKINKLNPSFWEFTDKGYSGRKTVGKFYAATKGMKLTEISKLIKKELSIEFPDFKFSIKTRNYSSINVTIEDVPYNPYSPEMDEVLKTNGKTYPSHDKYYTEQFKADRKKIEKIVQQYNMDDSDGQTDYFHNRYYGFVSLDDFAIKAKYYPNNEEVLRIQKMSDEWEERAAKRKEEADLNKGKYPKGSKVIYVTSPFNKTFLPEAEYEAVVVKCPNGRGRFTGYDINITLDKVIRKGVIVELKKPYVQTLKNVSENYLKPFEKM